MIFNEVTAEIEITCIASYRRAVSGEDFTQSKSEEESYGGALHNIQRGEGPQWLDGVVSVSLTLFQCSRSPGNDAERLLTVMKSRSPKVHRHRMHFRRSGRLSALAVRPDGKKKMSSS